jgi:RNA polymerase sigma-70 factor (ECF subfamily)
MALTEAYIQRVIALQPQLYAYILTLLADAAATDDVLQETNLVLCRKAEEFSEGTNFDAWAFQIARNQCLAFWKIRARDRLVLDDEAIRKIASRAESKLSEMNEKSHALQTCLSELPRRQRELLEGRYATGGSVKSLAKFLGRSEPSISQTLYRIRTALLECVRARLAREGVRSR